jgi:DNA-binding HxlR family transcriptional regulator
MMNRHGSARYSELRTLTSDPVNMNIGTFHKKLEELRRAGIIERSGAEKYTRPRIYRLSSKTLQIMDPCYSHFHELIKNLETDKEFINEGKGQIGFQSEIKRIFEILLIINLVEAVYSKRLKKKSMGEVSFDNGLHFIFKIILDEVSALYHKMKYSEEIITEENLKQFVNSFENDEEWIKETVKIYLSTYFSSPPP